MYCGSIFHYFTLSQSEATIHLKKYKKILKWLVIYGKEACRNYEKVQKEFSIGLLFLKKKPVDTMKKYKKNSQVVCYSWKRSL